VTEGAGFRAAQAVASTLLIACLALGGTAQGQTPARSAPVATVSGPAWSELSPLKKDWSQIDATRKQKWLEIAARFPSMPAEERQRIQDRMNEWARMTPDERGRARLQFQEARQISPQQRQERWDAYMALPAEERRALAARARTVPKAGGDTAARKADGSGNKPPQAATKIVAPTVVQAKPGASTTLISKPAAPPPHAQAGQPKIAFDKDRVDRSTLLPQPSAPKGTAASAPQ